MENDFQLFGIPTTGFYKTYDAIPEDTLIAIKKEIFLLHQHNVPVREINSQRNTTLETIWNALSHLAVNSN